MTRFLALILSLVLASGARADWPYDAVAQVTSDHFDAASGGYAGGSATLVGYSDHGGLLISCGHMWEDGGRSGTVDFPNVQGKWKCRVIGVDFQSDLSAMTIDDPPKMKVSAVVAADPQAGPFTCVGYPWYGQGTERWIQGNFIRIHGKDAQIRCIVHSGYSGGALFDSSGRYCGVICGNTAEADQHVMDRTYAPSGPTLLRFIGRFMKVDP